LGNVSGSSQVGGLVVFRVWNNFKFFFVWRGCGFFYVGGLVGHANLWNNSYLHFRKCFGSSMLVLGWFPVFWIISNSSFLERFGVFCVGG
jgi:hypothetical protein